MPKFITAYEIAAQIDEIIKQARQSVYLLSPYLKLTDNMYKNFFQAGERGLVINLVYGKAELNPDLKKKFYKLKNLNLLFVPNLHAKCYFNEQKAVIASMNLHEYSEKNNYEMGILADLQEDYSLYWDIVNESRYIIDQAEIKIKSKMQSNFQLKEEVTLYFEMLSQKFSNSIFRLVKDDFSGTKSIVAENFIVDGLDFAHNGKIEFYLNFPAELNEKIFREIEKKSFSNYRIYFNNSNKISIYPSIEHRDKWHTYNIDTKFELDLYIIHEVIKIVKRNHKLA